MYMQIGIFGHVLSVSFGPEEDDDDGVRSGILGGAGGQFERFVEPEEEWEYEEEDSARRARFGFC